MLIFNIVIGYFEVLVGEGVHRFLILAWFPIKINKCYWSCILLLF